MRCDIIIDQHLARRIDIDGRLKTPVRVADDIVAAVREARARHPAAERGFIVFASPAVRRRVIACLRALPASRALSRLIVLALGKKPVPLAADDRRHVAEYRTAGLSRAEYRFIVEQSLAWFKERFRRQRRERIMSLSRRDTDRDQEDLINIGRALSTEKNIDTLFRLILARAMSITGADAGSIYMVEEKAGGGKQIRVKYSHTASRHIAFEEAILPYSRETINGYVAITGKVLNIPDVGKLTAKSPVSYNPRYDREHNYRSQSMLVVPMRNHVDEIIGVIQLINSKENHRLDARWQRDPDDIILAAPEDYDRYVVPFDKRYNQLLEAVAGQAAIAIENARLIKQIETQFEEFVKASVFAIEFRDPATSGHSFRVAAMCAKMAEAINRRTAGPFKDVEFPAARRKELNYAALLHDYGKVYLDLRVFLKAKKLFPEDLEALMYKIDIGFRHAEICALLKEVELLKRAAASPEAETALRDLEREREANRQKVESVRQRLRALNEPAVSQEEPGQVIESVARVLDSFRCSDLDGRDIELISAREKSALLTPRGSLTSEERRTVESHVEHTYNIVSKIPWPRELERIPEIARAHHEMLNGSGYPRRLTGKEAIPIESRMMAIADVFDALTAKDRPYKPAVPVEKALLILKEEFVKPGKIDPDLFALFTEERVWED